MMEHVRDDLSAYLDGALTAAERSAVDAHLAACPPCRTSLAELRSTARLIAALPAAAPSRRLVPALAPRANWLRPLRSLSAVAAGTFLLAFMASATLDTGFRMGGGAAGTATSSFSREGAAPAAAPAPATPGGVAADAAATASPPPAALSAASGVPKVVGPATPPSSDAAVRRQEGAGGVPETQVAPEPPRIGPSPWLWLGLGVLSALLAFVAHRRLRAR